MILLYAGIFTLKKKNIIGVLLDNIEENILKSLWPILNSSREGGFPNACVTTRRRKLGYPIYIVNIDEGSRSDFMLQNSKSDVFSIVTEYVEVRQSFLFAFVELVDTVRFYLSHCLPIFCSVTKHDEPFKKVCCMFCWEIIIFHENIFWYNRNKSIELSFQL